jgi:hypothetical protein
MKKMLFIVLIGVGFFGCEFAIEDQVTGKYYMIASDSGEQCSLSFKLNNSGYSTIISACVYSVGFNDYYIIAKQHPFEFAKELDKSVTQYFILPLNNGKNRNSKHDLIGPLSLNQFELETDRLDIKGIKFTMSYDYME